MKCHTAEKLRRSRAFGISSIKATTFQMATGYFVYILSQNFNFISFPDELTTGSSIMPHKKNRCFELNSWKMYKLQADYLPNVSLLLTHL